MSFDNQKYYAIVKLEEAARSIKQAVNELPILRKRLEKLKENKTKAREVYSDLQQQKNPKQCQKSAGHKRAPFLLALQLVQIQHRCGRTVVAKKAQDFFPVVFIVHRGAEQAFCRLIFVLGNRNGHGGLPLF